MCGQESYLLKAVIEGTELKVCKNCTKYGKVIGKIRQDKQFKKKTYITPEKEKETEDFVVENYSKLIKNARESLNLKQEDVAKKISEKESVIHHIESGSHKPSIPLAKKFEKFFNIKLIEQFEDKYEKQSNKSNGIVTIGDKIKIRKR